MWAPEGWAQTCQNALKGGAPEGWWAQNFALFFLPASIFVLFVSLSLGVFSWNLVVFEAPGPSNVHVWSSWASHDSPRAQTCTLEGPGISNTTKIQREDTKRETKRAEMVAGEEKKKRNFGRSGGGGVPRRWGPEGPNQQPLQHHQQQHQQQSHKNGLAKNGLAQIGLTKVGHDRPFKSQTYYNPTWRVQR